MLARCAITVLVPPLWLGTTSHSVSNGAPCLHAPLATTPSNGACRPRCIITNLGEARYFGSHPTICIDLPTHSLSPPPTSFLLLTLFAPYRSTQNKYLYLLFSLVSKVSSLSLYCCVDLLLFSLEHVHLFFGVYVWCDVMIMGYICMFVVIVGV